MPIAVLCKNDSLSQRRIMYYTNCYYKGKKEPAKKFPYRTPMVNQVIQKYAADEMSGTGAAARMAEDVISNRSAFCPPHKLIMNVSDKCNFSCKMCAFHPGQQKNDMTLDKWKALVWETCHANVVYTLFGGEPLLYPDIDELVSYMGQLGVQMYIVTNGSLLEKHLGVLLENHCHIVLSLDGVGKVHDTIRGYHGSFAKIEEMLVRIFGNGTPQEQKLVSINSVLLPENADSVRSLIDYLYGIGVPYVSFQHLQYFGENEREKTDRIWRDFFRQPFTCTLQPRKKFVFNQKNLEKLKAAVRDIRKAKQVYKDMGIYIDPDFSEEELEIYFSGDHERLQNKSLCMNPWASATVSVDGSISLCLDACIGNFMEQNFWSAWYGEKAQTFRKCVADQVFPVCTRCCNFYNSYIPD